MGAGSQEPERFQRAAGAIGSGTQLQTKTPQITLITQIQKAWRIKRLRRVVPAARFFEQAAPILDPEFFIKSVNPWNPWRFFSFFILISPGVSPTSDYTHLFLLPRI